MAGDRAAGVARVMDSPFYVLGLRPEATRAEVEREGQKWLGMLELGLAAAQRYVTPLGVGERTADKVRAALAELRDPERRVLAEVWARLQPTEEAAEGEAGTELSDASTSTKVGGLEGALKELGF